VQRWKEALVLWWWVVGCASWMGLEELEALPPDFPIEVVGEPGNITTLKESGQVSVDLAFEDEAKARAGWSRLRERAEAVGFAVTDEGHADKRDHVVLEGPGGKLKLSCCPRRADRQRLVLLTWWEPSAR
jgi:hypothetical protein